MNEVGVMKASNEFKILSESIRNDSRFNVIGSDSKEHWAKEIDRINADLRRAAGMPVLNAAKVD